MKGIEAQNGKPPTLTQVIDVFIGDEQKKKEETRYGTPSLLPWIYIVVEWCEIFLVFCTLSTKMPHICQKKYQYSPPLLGGNDVQYTKYKYI